MAKQRRKTRRRQLPDSKGWKKILVVIGIVFASAFAGALATFVFVEVRRFLDQPRLVAYESWVEVTWIMRQVREGNTVGAEAVAVAKDPWTGKRLLEETRVKFSWSKDDFLKRGLLFEIGDSEEQVPEPDERAYVGKILVVNRGRSDLKRLLMGISVPFEADSSVYVTPNVQVPGQAAPSGIADETKSLDITTSLEFFREHLKAVHISKLPSHSRAVVTFMWIFDPDAMVDVSPGLEEERMLVPKVEFAFSGETRGEVRSDMSFEQVLEAESEIMGGSFEIPWHVSMTSFNVPFCIENISDSPVRVMIPRQMDEDGKLRKDLPIRVERE